MVRPAVTAKHVLGHLPNAPLAYVLAQVRVSKFMEMPRFVEPIHKRLRSLFRGLRESEGRLIHLSPEPRIEPVKRWEFYDLSNKEGALIQNNSIVFHATTYEDGKTFLARLRALLEAVDAVLPSSLIVERLGLRYIDVVVPGDDEHPNDYVVDGLKGVGLDGRGELTTTGIEMLQSVHAMTYQCARGLMSFRYLVLAAGAEPLPEELYPLALYPSDVMQQARQSQRSFGLLDTDRFLEQRSEFHPDALIGTLTEMQEDVSTIFKAIASDHAWAIWTGKDK